MVCVNFIAILIDGTTERAVKEQVLYIMNDDQETHKPTLCYFEVVEMDKFDQTAPGMLAAING